MKWIKKKSPKISNPTTLKHMGLIIKIPKGYWFAVGQTGYAYAYSKKEKIIFSDLKLF